MSDPFGTLLQISTVPISVLATTADRTLRTRVFFIALTRRRSRLDISFHVEGGLEIVGHLRVGHLRQRTPSLLGGGSILDGRIISSRLSVINKQ